MKSGTPWGLPTVEIGLEGALNSGSKPKSILTGSRVEPSSKPPFVRPSPALQSELEWGGRWTGLAAELGNEPRPGKRSRLHSCSGASAANPRVREAEVQTRWPSSSRRALLHLAPTSVGPAGLWGRPPLPRGDAAFSRVLAGELKAKRRGKPRFQARAAPALIPVSRASVSCHVGLDNLLGFLSALASLGYGMGERKPSAVGDENSEVLTRRCSLVFLETFQLFFLKRKLNHLNMEQTLLFQVEHFE